MTQRASSDRRHATRCAVVTTAFALITATMGYAQIVAQPPIAPIAPAWDKGIQPISRDSYYNAIECGKKGGANPPCVFYDTGLCKNDDFTLALFTPYKMVAYEVWQAVRKKQEPPMPSYAEAQRTRITLGVTPVAGSNPIASVSIARGDRIVKPVTQSLEAGGGKFIFDFSTFAPTEEITLHLAGRNRTLTCSIAKPVLALFR
jgi:hypothetical protein